MREDLKSEAICGARIFDGTRFRDDHALVHEAGVISAIIRVKDVPGETKKIRLDGGILAPGFIDAQVNGGGSVLFNESTTVKGIAAIIAAHRQFGTTSLLPTLITDTKPVMQAAIRAAAEAAQTIPGCLGLHLEGPFLAPSRKGAHLAERMHTMTDDDVAWLSSLDVGRLLLTVATEQVTPSQISRLAKAGVIVSLGHCDANHTDATAAFASGARGVTHLFNAMSQISSREPGLVGAALNAPAIWCGIIADGHHVSPENVKLAFRAKAGPGKVFLVTDAMASMGSANDSFVLNGRTIYRNAGRLTLADGTLAGSDLDMAGAVRFCVNTLGVSLAETLRRASLYPAQFLGLADKRGRIRKGMIADLVHLDDKLHVTRTWVGGKA